MIDRRKRVVGQVWRARFPSHYDYGRYFLPQGEYQIISLFKNHYGQDMVKVYNIDRDRTHEVPRKMISSADRQGGFEFRRNAELPKPKPQFVLCATCGSGDVAEIIGRTGTHTCRFCGGRVRLGG